MPQIAQILETYASQIFWLLLVFGLIYIVIGKGMLPKVEQTVEARDRKIAEDLAAAERARAAAAESEHGWQDVLEASKADALRTTQAAKDAAAKANAAQLADIDATLSVKMAEGEAAVARALAAAEAEIEGIAADIAGDLVNRLSGLSVERTELEATAKAVTGNA